MTLKREMVFATLSIIVLFASALLVPSFAQNDVCRGYDIVQIDTVSFVDAGIDLSEVRCTSFHVVDEDGMITDIFVIPESTVGSYLRGADLTGMDLVGIDFSYAILRDAMLQDISAQGVMFVETDFSFADLSNSDLSFAYFNFASLQEANLTEANLSGAELTGADFTLADMTNTNVEGAIGYEDE